MTQNPATPPWVFRAVPFFAFIFLMAVADPGQFYALRTGAVALLLLVFFRHYSELAWPPSLAFRDVLISAGTGIAIFLIWILLSDGWMVIGEGRPFNPHDAYGEVDYFRVLLRGLGAALVVPLMEELFWRSFLMRWIEKQDFLALSPMNVSIRALLISSVLFALEHTLWLAGLLAGLAYGWLYMRTANLWAPVLAHAITNSVLGIWVISTGNWKFW